MLSKFIEMIVNVVTLKENSRYEGTQKGKENISTYERSVSDALGNISKENESI